MSGLPASKQLSLWTVLLLAVEIQVLILNISSQCSVHSDGKNIFKKKADGVILLKISAISPPSIQRKSHISYHCPSAHFCTFPLYISSLTPFLPLIITSAALVTLTPGTFQSVGHFPLPSTEKTLDI